MNWITNIKMSIPEHLEMLEKNLDKFMTEHELSEIEANGVALAAAIATNNNELAYMIAVDEVLFGNDLRETISRIVVSLQVSSVYDNFVNACSATLTKMPPTDFITIDTEKNDKGAIYAFAATLALTGSRSTFFMKKLFEQNYTIDQIQDIANIVSIISTLNKIAI